MVRQDRALGMLCRNDLHVCMHCMLGSIEASYVGGLLPASCCRLQMHGNSEGGWVCMEGTARLSACNIS